MFSHIMVGSNDLDRSKRFYNALFAAIGGAPGALTPMGRLVYDHKGDRFLVTKPLDGAPACHANGGTIGFRMESPEQTDMWHKAGVEAGGTTVEDPPGWRERSDLRMYLAYLRDPDGNKLCGLYSESF